jgi:hypothetical protein
LAVRGRINGRALRSSKRDALLTTESRIDLANEQMASIANDTTDDKRARLRAIWQPIAFDLIDRSFSEIDDRDLRLLVSNPNFVGVTCDTGRPVFLEKQTSSNGFVYRKFRVEARATVH